MGQGTASQPVTRQALFGARTGLMPWTSPQRVFDCCIGCGACARVCPEGIVATGRGGHPYLDFSGECTFCGACAKACPEDVFDLAQNPPLAAVARIGKGCFEPLGIACRACEDACPEAALRTRPRLGGTAEVEVDARTCTGCGACVPTCPVDAIAVVALPQPDKEAAHV